MSLTKLIKLALDGIFAFSNIPLKLATYLGFFIATSAFMISLVGLVYKYLFGVKFLGWDYGLTSIFFLGGIQLIFLGILGEYIGRIYEEVKHRPKYIIREIIGSQEKSLEHTL